MNDLEFREQYKRLAEVHPIYFDNKEKMQTVWRFVNDMDQQWFKTLVDRIVMSNSASKFDIGLEVNSEKRNRANLKFTEDVIKSLENRHGISDNGLESVLNKYKLKSLSDAINYTAPIDKSHNDTLDND